MLSKPVDLWFSRTLCLSSSSSTPDVLKVRISVFGMSARAGPNLAAPSRVKTTYRDQVSCLFDCQLDKACNANACAGGVSVERY